MDKELLFKPRLAEDEVELDGVGTVRIRALSREEVANAREDNEKLGELDLSGYEYFLVAASMVDPALTVDEVRRWASAAPAGELVRVMEAIQQLSGLDEESSKSSVRPNRRERRAAVRTRSRS